MIDITINIQTDLLITIPESSSGDTVTYEIFDADGTVATSGSMTFVRDEVWKVADYTPSTLGTYILKANDTTITSKREEIVRVVGTDFLTATSGDLTTLANLRAFLKKQTADTSDNALLSSIITRVSADVAKRCNRTFQAGTVTEYYEGDGSCELLLRRAPVNSITSIHIDSDREWSSDTAIDSDNIIISDTIEGLVTLNGDYFDKGLGIENVRVIYNGGYTTIPGDLERNALRLCAWDYLEASRWNNTMIKGERSVDDLRDQVWKEIINTYKLVRF